MNTFSLKRRPPRALAKSQSGVVLVVCLVLLLVVTALGLSSMGSTSLEMKMASGFRDRSVAFEVTEEALSVAEAWLSETNINDTDYLSTCSGTNCFSADCVAGLCAFYDSTDPFLSTHELVDCGTHMDIPGTSVWRWAGAAGEPNLWLDNAKSVAVDPTHPDVTTDARYIIEFMCYTDRVSGTACVAGNPASCAPHFRVTAMGRGLTDSSVVMLQSIFKKVN